MDGKQLIEFGIDGQGDMPVRSPIILERDFS